MYFPDQDEYPNNNTVYVQVAWEDDTFTRASGAMVGRNDVLTASHVVYSPGKTAVDIDVFPAYDGAEGPWGSFTDGAWQTNYYEVGNADRTISWSDSAWDLALIGLSDAMGDRTGWYGMRSHQGEGTYEVLGYPGEQGTALAGDRGHLNYEHTDFWHWLNGSQTGVYDISDVYHAPGSSGGPILNEANEVCGVVSSTSYGARIDEEWDKPDTVDDRQRLATGLDEAQVAVRSMRNMDAAGIRLVGVLLTVGLVSCEEQPAMARSDLPHTPATGTSSSGEANTPVQPSRAELRRRCLESLARISPVGQRLTPGDEGLAGLVERPGQTLTQTASLGRPHISVDARGIILKRRCY